MLDPEDAAKAPIGPGVCADYSHAPKPVVDWQFRFVIPLENYNLADVNWAFAGPAMSGKQAVNRKKRLYYIVFGF